MIETTTLTKQRRKEILLDAIIIGAGGFKVCHTTIAPCRTGYTVIHDMLNKNQPITCDEIWTENLPEKLYAYLINRWFAKDFDQLEKEVNEKWDNLPKFYHKDEYRPLKKYPTGRYIANGYETDGFYNIVKGRCMGNHISNTTITQNELSRELIVLKGYCTDAFLRDELNTTYTEKMLQAVYQRHGIDSDFSNINEWCKRNPTRCTPESPFYQNNL